MNKDDKIYISLKDYEFLLSKIRNPDNISLKLKKAALNYKKNFNKKD